MRARDITLQDIKKAMLKNSDTWQIEKYINEQEVNKIVKYQLSQLFMNISLGHQTDLGDQLQKYSIYAIVGSNSLLTNFIDKIN